MKAAFANGGTNHCIQSGAIATAREYANLHRLFLRRCNMDFPQARLSTVFERLNSLIQEFQPDRVAIEEVFYSVNAKSALKLGQVRGVAMLAASSQKLQIGEYAPLTIKASVVGYGRAEKEQVQMMVARLLCLQQIPEPADAADALAIAICDLHTQATLMRQRAGA